jgi:very-short-patch-repair endonuclease
MRGECRHDPADRAIGALAELQYGVVTRSQLSELGLGRRAIDHRLELGRLCPIHRGVYTVGHRLLTRNGRWMAAVLACGPDAVLSHRAAAALWGIRGGTRIEVTVPRGRRGPRNIKLHWTDLPDDETTTHHQIPTTTVPRTLLDLSAVVTRDELRAATRQADHLRLTDPLWLGDLIERYPRRPGLPSVKAVVEEAQHGLTRTRSELEERFQAFLIRAGLPLPRTNAIIEGLEVDCVWPEHRLIVELDGHATHAPAHAFEADRARDRKLEAAGWRVIRITWRQLHDTPDEVERDMRCLLQGAGVSASGPISATELHPASPIVRSKSATKFVTTSRTPASPASARPYT